jgi:hypothetical protein
MKTRTLGNERKALSRGALFGRVGLGLQDLRRDLDIFWRVFLNTFPVSTDTARHALSHVRQRARREYLGSLRRGHRGRGRRPQDERQGSKGQVIQAQAQAQGFEVMGQANARMCAARRSRGVCVHARGTSRGGGTYASVISKRISGRAAVGYRRYRRPPPAFSTSEAWKPGSNFVTDNTNLLGAAGGASRVSIEVRSS